MSKVDKQVQNAFINILEALQPDEDNFESCRLVAKALGFTDKEIDEDLGLEFIGGDDEESEP